MKHFFKNNWYILLLYFACIAVSLGFLLSYGKVQIHVYINQLVGNPILDNFFYFITYLGDGAVMPILLIFVLIYNIRLGIYTTISFTFAAIVTNFLKYQFFNNVDRPFHVFKWTIHQPLKFVDVGDIHIHNSFPSGHATQAFAIFMCLSFFSKRPEIKILFLVVALAAAFSRVHLSQHWLVDITAGSLIGTLSSIIFYY
ncbi:MAG: phosphatase PAP2 family protein, partial [Bacteroidia bacterium]